MIPAFWDTSALVPLCVEQQSSNSVRKLATQLDVTVWWGTSVEIRSAIERLQRMGQLTPSAYVVAELKAKKLQRGWRELGPTETLRSQSEYFLTRFPLKAADAMQLAAAWIWCNGDTHSCNFVSADGQLLTAARLLGFQIVTP
jgi:predicted nucleic acid-binding protein